MNKINYCLAVLLLLSFNIIAQDNSHEFEIILAAGPGSKSTISPNEGKYPVYSNPFVAFQIGADYRYLFDLNWSISGGLRFEAGGPNIITDAYVSQISTPPSTMELKVHEEVSLFSLPVSIEYRFRQNKINTNYLQCGIKINYAISQGQSSMGYSFYDENGAEIISFGESSNNNNNGAPWFSLQFGGGIRWRHKNGGRFQTGILGNLSFSKVVRGTYYVITPDQPNTYGEFNNRLSSIVFVLGYRL